MASIGKRALTLFGKALQLSTEGRELWIEKLEATESEETLEQLRAMLNAHEIADSRFDDAQAMDLFGRDTGRAVAEEALMRLSAPRTPFERYTVGKEIDKGGMGRILSVWDEDFGRELAMKACCCCCKDVIVVRCRR